MNIKYHDLIIRNATIKDAEILCSWWNDGIIMEHAGFPNGLGTTCDKIALQIVDYSDNTHSRLIIELSGDPIGEMCYLNKGNKIAEIGIKICNVIKQEKGYGKQILSMLINELFENLKYEKIILDTNLKNTRAQHVYERLGFCKLRVNVDSWRDQLGKLQSSVDYELTKDKFVNFAK